MQQKTSSISDFVNEIESRIKAVKDGASIVRYANNYDCNNDTPLVTVTTIESLTDEELAELVKTAHNIRLPRFLNDKDNLTQRFVFAAHLNSKPTVLSKELFNQFILDNSIPQNQIMARSVRDNMEMLLSADQIIDMFKYSDMNYIGGKFGGSVMGNGAYFEMNGGQETIYENLYHFRYKDRFVVLPDGKCGYQNFKIRDGQRIDTDIINICDYKQGKTMIAVYNPSTARVIKYLTLIKKAKQFEKNHPMFVKEVGHFDPPNSFPNNASIYALAMGYNAIADYNPKSPTYKNQCVIDRSAVIVREEEL